MVTQTLTDKLKEKISWLPGFLDMQRVSPTGKRDFQLTFEPRYWNSYGSEIKPFSLSQECTKGLAMASEFTKELLEDCYIPRPADFGQIGYDNFPYSLTETGFTFKVPDGRIWFNCAQRSGNIYFPSIGLSYCDKRVPQMSYLVSDKGVKLADSLNKFGKSLPAYLKMSYNKSDIDLRGEVRAENIKKSAILAKSLRKILQDVPCNKVNYLNNLTKT